MIDKIHIFTSSNENHKTFNKRNLRKESTFTDLVPCDITLHSNIENFING